MIDRRLPAALAACLLLAGCGAATQHAGDTLSVRPAHPTTRSELRFGFRAPIASGVHGRDEITYSLSVTGPAGVGCVGAHEQGSPAARDGQAVSIAVGPQALGRRWCAGDYTARVIELQSAHCTGSTPCPQYIRVVGIIARTSFKVLGH